jgi:hypothetical protein
MKIKSKLTVLGLVPQDSIGFADVFVFGAVMHIVFLRYFLFKNILKNIYIFLHSISK